MDFFSKHKEFTHIVVSPDDLVVKREHYEALVKTLEKNVDKYPVFGAVCNINTSTPKTLNICIDHSPHVIRRLRRYIWADADTVQEGIIKVKFAGMPFMFIRRDILQQIPILGDTRFDIITKHKEPKSFDCPFCWECNKKEIPIHVDTRIKLLHLRGEEAKNYVDKYPPKVYFQVNDEIEDLTNYYYDYVYELNQYSSRLFLSRWRKKLVNPIT